MKLNVPVAIYPTTNNKLLVLGGGNFYVTDFPVQPYKYCESDSSEDPLVNIIGGGTARLGKMVYPVVPRAHDARPGKQKNTAEFDYIRSLILDYPDIIEALAEDLQFDDPYPAYFDIETGATDGTFSKAEKDEIVSIQYKYRGDRGITVLHQTSQYSEKQMIMDFCNAIKTNPRDPNNRGADHLVGYFLTKFDVPYILKRAEILGIKDFVMQTLSKIDYNKYTIDYSRFTNQKPDEVVYPAEGLSCIDLFLHAKSDFALAGIASRSLKSVSARYGLSDITDLSSEEKSDMGGLLRKNRDRFIKYAASDIRCTEFLDNIYSPRIAASSNLLQCPYNLIHRMTAGQKSFVAMYREARRRNFYSFYKNSHENRYADLYMRSQKYQGATVECHKKGYFDKTIYVDCKCMNKENLVYTNKGHKKIGDLKPGDMVLNDKGYVKVLHVENVGMKEEITIETSSGRKIGVSKEHRLPVYKKYKKAGYSENDTMVDVEAGNIKPGDILKECHNYFMDDIQSISKNSAELLGIFDAKGYFSDRKQDRIRYDRNNTVQKGIRYTQVSFSVHSKEKELRERIISLMNEITDDNSPNVCIEGNKTTIQYGSHKTYDEFNDLYALREHILSCKDTCAAYLRGLYSGDETYNKRRKTISFTQSTKNDDVIKFASMCLTRCGFVHTISPTLLARIPGVSKLYYKQMIEIPTRQVERFLSEIGFIGEKGKIDCNLDQMKPKNYIRDGYYLTKVRSVENTGRLVEMVDIMVETQDHPYFYANGILSHNSMYPNIMYDFNVSYDKYTYLGLIEYSEYKGEHEVTVIGTDPTKLILLVPDDNYKAMLKFETDLISDGFIRDIITKYNGIRDEYKKKSKEFEGKKDPDSIKQFMNFDAVQAEAKVINNTFYGLQGNKGYEFADLPAAILVTAIGRWLMGQMKELFKECTIEVDTDGILLDRGVMPNLTIDQINDILKDKIADKFYLHERRGKLKFLLEFEGAGSVYMYKEKNYILRKDGKEKLIIKGSAFKGYDKAPVVSRGVGILAEAVMFKTKTFDAAMRESFDIHSLPLEMFKMHKTLKKKLSEYKGYENLAIFCKDVDRNSSSVEIFKLMKKKAHDWLKDHFVAKENGNKTNDIKVCSKLITACRTEVELDAAIEVIDSYNTTTAKATPNFMMKAIMKLMKDKKAVAYEKEIEYFYSITPDGFSFEYDMDSKKDLDYQAYIDDLGKVLERFEYADPVSGELDIF